VFAIYRPQALKDRRATLCGSAACGTDYQFTPCNDGLLIGDRNSHASVQRINRGVDAHKPRCSCNNEIWCRTQDCIAQIYATESHESLCTWVRGC
jgi:hypothetical protein